jgi:predicted transcriptional regulator
MKEKVERVTVRLTASEHAKLQRIAEATARPMADVFRRLLSQAEVADKPDVRLAGKGEHGE